MSVGDNLKRVGLMTAYDYLDRDPNNNLIKLFRLAQKLDKDGGLKTQLEALKPIVEDPDNTWCKFIKSFWTDVDSNVRKAIFTNFIVNANMKANPKRKANIEKYGCNIPWAILMDPTSACNLKCTGCWAAEYGNRLNMSFDTLDSIIEQGKELGVYFYIFSGGEPLVRKHDIIALCNKHSDCEFLAFTNGTLIDEEFANDMLRVKNFIPAISVEGFKEDTDFRRGEGTFDRVMEAMALLKRKKLVFGVSCCYTSHNVDTIGSEEYYDKMIEWGAKFCWFFTYIPVGHKAAPELMASAEQREFMYHQVRKFRQTKPIFVIDFWNDGDYVKGCIAGGQSYLHISANGDIEPCAFIHYADSNIYKDTLLEALRAPLMMAYHDRQPFNENLLRPCPLLDNPEKLREMVNLSGARSTDLEDPEDVEDLTGKCEEAAKNWAPKADALWELSPKCKGGCACCADKKKAI